MVETAPMGLTANLLVSAVVTAILSFFLIARRLSLVPAALISGVKVAIPTVYFAWFYTGRWTILDDLRYTDKSIDLLSEGYTPISILLPENLGVLYSVAHGPHFLYYWWNMVSMTAFGPHYYAPVFFNILLTIGISMVFWKCLDEMGFCKEYRSWAFIFLLLHWDIVSWSSLLNIKDILVLFLTTCLLYGFVLLFTMRNRRAILKSGILIVSCTFALLWIRFYAPVLVVLGAIGYLFTDNSQRWIIYPTLFLSPLSIPIIDRGLYSLNLIDISNPLLGAVQFIFTPKPWGINPSYSFLLVPSMLHWMMALLAVIGAMGLFINSTEGRFFILYAGAVVCFFAVVPHLIGPRHRLQMVLPQAWVQFHGLWILYNRIDFRVQDPSSSRRLPESKS
jgi:hypothetical protein